MAYCDREKAFAALFEKLRLNVPQVPPSNWTRRQGDYTSCSTDLPAVGLVTESAQVPTNEKGKPAKWTLEARVQVWCRTPTKDSGIAPGTQLNDIITTIEKVLAWDPKLDVASGQYIGDMIHSTLGGICAHAWISDVEVVPGTAGDEAEAVMLIEMVDVSV